MKQYKTNRYLQKCLAKHRNLGLTIGFVPTMGALHAGHISLVKVAKASCDIVVCSIYVNPTQFNKEEDLVNYPRTVDEDTSKLKEAGCDIAFVPSDKEIYPNGMDQFVVPDIGPIIGVLEGEFRPGHFEGMMQVVARFLEIIQPNQLFMGLKDYQQFAIVSKMVEVLKMDVTMRGMPIVRESSGLAMSSRNKRLSKQGKTAAAIVFQTLSWVKKELRSFTLEELEVMGKNKINERGGFEVEYFSIVDQQTLLPPSKKSTKRNLIALTAVWKEGIRLIDNMIL